MTFVNPLRAKWSAGQPTFGAWLSSGEPIIAEYLAGCGYDEVVADLQHGAIDPVHLPALFQAIESRHSAPAARVAANDYTQIGRVLDMGALNVIVPMVETADEAARAVTACRYPPAGTRSMGPLRSMITMGSFDPVDLGQVTCLVQVETARGLANVDAIAATPGLDGIYIGPSDLGLSMGLFEIDHDPAQQVTHARAIEQIVESCQRHGIVPAIITANGAGTRKRLAQGFRHITVTSDLALIGEGGARELAVAMGTA
jgi:4-hydroxy-2-oxoheptanedioate aldolase